MLPFDGLLGRVANALLYGVLAFLVFFILGAITVRFDPEIGTKLREFAPIVGLLVGLVTFFSGFTTRNQ